MNIKHSNNLITKNITAHYPKNPSEQATITPAVMGCNSTYTHTCVPPTALYLDKSNLVSQ